MRSLASTCPGGYGAVMKTSRLAPGLLILLLTGLPVLLPAQAPGGGTEDEEEYEVVGLEMQRADGRFLGLAIEGNAFVLRFYDEEKKPETPDAIRAMARWNSPQKAGQQRTVLTGAGEFLRSPPIVRPPYSFVAYLTLIGPDDAVLDSFAFNTRNLP